MSCFQSLNPKLRVDRRLEKMFARIRRGLVAFRKHRLGWWNTLAQQGRRLKRWKRRHHRGLMVRRNAALRDRFAMRRVLLTSGRRGRLRRGSTKSAEKEDQHHQSSRDPATRIHDAGCVRYLQVTACLRIESWREMKSLCFPLADADRRRFIGLEVLFKSEALLPPYYRL